MRNLRTLLAEANRFVGEGPRRNGKGRLERARRRAFANRRQTTTQGQASVRSRGNVSNIKQVVPNKNVKQVPAGKAPWDDRTKDYYNKYLPQETAEERVETVANQKRNRRNFYEKPEKSSAIKGIRFLNLSDASIYAAISAIQNNTPLPSWAIHVKDKLEYKDGRLLLENRPFLLKEEKHNLCKRSYFDPKRPSTPRDIYEHYEQKYANLTRKDCFAALRRLETYQLLHRRRKPPTITGRMKVNRPGVIAVDTFFPSELNGWRGKRTIFTCTDVWSRYVRAYVCRDKEKDTIGMAFERFLKSFVKTSGVLPRRVLADKGSELERIKTIMERFRKPADRNADLVLNSITGAPITFVEHVQAHIQRLAQIHQNQVDGDFDVLVDAVCQQINNKPRKDKGNLSPIQLLQLSRNQRITVNKNYIDRVPLGSDNMKPIKPGDRVRLLTWTRKEQVESKKKGFSEKWSREIYTVLKKTKIQKNPGFHNYYLNGLSKPRYRHELLKIPAEIDRVIPKIRRI